MTKATTRALLFRVLMLLYIFAVMYLCFSHLDKMPDVPKVLFGIQTDKIAHFCMFFPFPILGFFAYDRLTDTPLKAFAAIITILAIGGIFAGLTEMVQGAMPYRTEDIHDYYADLIGLGLASILVFVIDLSKMKKSGNRLSKGNAR